MQQVRGTTERSVQKRGQREGKSGVYKGHVGRHQAYFTSSSAELHPPYSPNENEATGNCMVPLLRPEPMHLPSSFSDTSLARSSHRKPRTRAGEHETDSPMALSTLPAVRSGEEMSQLQGGTGYQPSRASRTPPTTPPTVGALGLT